VSYLAVGADISVNHSAVVALTAEGQCATVRYLCSKKMDAKKRLGGERVLIKIARHKTKEQFEMERLVWLRDYYDTITEWLAGVAIANKAGAVYVAQEAYAFSAGQRRSKDGMPIGGGSKPYQIGEAGAIFKLACKDLGFKMRLHDPSSVKMFATGLGNAPKDDVRNAVYKMIYEDRSGLELECFPSDKDGGVQGDVADAYVLAMMARLEVEVRAGRVSLADLDKDKRRIFLRTTKTNPVNLLDRPWS